MKPPKTRAMNQHNWGGIRTATTELESYKQVEPLDEGKKLS